MKLNQIAAGQTLSGVDLNQVVTVVATVPHGDAAFGEALLREGIDTMLSGDVDTGKAIRRHYIKATVGFEKLGQTTGTQPKSLIRMFGPRENASRLLPKLNQAILAKAFRGESVPQDINDKRVRYAH